LFAGAKLLMMESNGQMCDVSCYSPDLISIKNISIEKTATTNGHNNGTPYIWY